MLISPVYFRNSAVHLFFTYIIPLIPFVVAFDGYVSSLRTRTPDEVLQLLNGGRQLDGWKFMSGEEMHTFPIGYLSWIICVKED